MVFRCSGIAQVLCTSWLLVAVLIYAVATILAHRALGVLVPALAGLPTNLKDGVNSVMRFDSLEADATVIVNNSKAGLLKCGITSPASVCDNLPPPVPGNTQNTGPEVTAIAGAFDRTLVHVEKLTEDPYLGIAEFQSLGAEIRAVKANLTTLRSQQQPLDCVATNPIFCALHKNGDQMTSGMADVRSGVDQMTDSPVMQRLQRASEQVIVLHALPYVAWLGLLFYMCVFCGRDGSCRSCSGLKCLSCAGNGVFYVLFLLISLAIVVGGVLVVKFGKSREISGFAAQPVAPVVLVEHIQEAFPAFYSLVLEDLLVGLKQLFNTFIIFIFAELMLAVHMMSACCCKIYVAKQSS